jgi:hypothetical protein
VTNFYGDSYCKIYLHDVTDGRLINYETATRENRTVTLSSGGSQTVYLSLWNCTVDVSPAR